MIDRHLDTIEKSILASETEDKPLIYTFEDGFVVISGIIEHDALGELTKLHGICKEIRKSEGV